MVRQNLRYTHNDVDYLTLYGDSFTLPGGWAGDPVNKRLFGRFAFIDLNRVRMLAADQHVEGDFVTGAVRHKLLAGLDAVRFEQSGETGFDAPVYDGGTVPLIDAYAPVYGVGFTPSAGVRQGRIGPAPDRPVPAGPAEVRAELDRGRRAAPRPRDQQAG